MNEITSKVTSKLLWRNVGYGGAIVFGVFAVFACFLSFSNKGEPITALIVSYAFIAVCGAITSVIGEVQYRRVSGKAEPEKEKLGKKRKPEKAKAVAKQRPKVQKPKWLLSLKEQLGSLKKLFGGLLESLRMKIGRVGKKQKPDEVIKGEPAQPAQIEEPAQVKEIPKTQKLTEVKEAAQVEEVEVAAPSDDFFDGEISKETGKGADADLDKAVGEAIGNGALSQEQKESEPKEVPEDDIIELRSVDEVKKEEQQND